MGRELGTQRCAFNKKRAALSGGPVEAMTAY
jgi:hypothetical protein